MFLARLGCRKHLLRHVWQIRLQCCENLNGFILRDVIAKPDGLPADFALQSVVVAFTCWFPPFEGTGNRLSDTLMCGSNPECVW